MLRTSVELEKEFDRVPIELAMPQSHGTGVLQLRGEHTSALIRVPQYDRRLNPSRGFTDLQVKNALGRRFLLHNAFARRSQQLPYDSGWEFDIFPNIVVIDSNDIFPSCRIKQLNFTLKGLERVFYYEIAEWHSMHGARKETVAALKEIRKLETRYPRSHDFFHAEDVFLVHRLPRVLKEVVDDRTYEIYVRDQQVRNGNGISISPVVIASIKFASPVTISEALDCAWAWRRFFHQITMMEMPFERMNCKAPKKGGQWSSLYLSNIAEEENLERDVLFDFRSGDVPYGEWKYRKCLSEAMGKWLASDPERRAFRGRLERAINRARREYSPNILLEICAGIEGLNELKKGVLGASDNVEPIIQAAIAAAKLNKIPIEEARIRGILSLLHHESLSRRLKTLTSQSNLNLSNSKLSKLNGKIVELRNLEAHGTFWDDITIPSLAPIIEIISCICVLWDLSTSGLPSKHQDRMLVALKRLSFFEQKLSVRQGT